MSQARDTQCPGTLPPEAAFVLQLQGDTDVGAGSLVGRVEHIASGVAARVASIDELLAFIARALEAPPGRGDGGS